MLVSEYIGTRHAEFRKRGVLDSFLEFDAKYYINIKALQSTKEKYFMESYKKIMNYFRGIYSLLKVYNLSRNERIFKEAMKKFNFPEVNEIKIGLADGEFGKGLTSKSIREDFLRCVSDLIKYEEIDENIFMIVSLLAEGVGVDFISDMIANIIKDDIIAYTKQINFEIFGDEKIFTTDKGKEIWYLPMSILSEIPMPRYMLNVDAAIKINSECRSQVNALIGKALNDASKKEKTNAFISYLINGKGFKTFFEHFENDEYQEYNFDIDKVGLLKMIDYYLILPKIDTIGKKSYQITVEIIENFKNVIENNGCYRILKNDLGKVVEKKCQDAFRMIGVLQSRENDWDFTCEGNNGRGQLDFKISRGNDKTIIEMKRLGSDDYLNGIEHQILEYQKAEKAKNMIYLVVDDVIDGKKKEERLKEIEMAKCKLLSEGYEIDVFVVDANDKKSASQTYC